MAGTVHSLLMAMSPNSKTTFHFISPDELKMPEEYKYYLHCLGLKYAEQKDFSSKYRLPISSIMTRGGRKRGSRIPSSMKERKMLMFLKNKMLERPQRKT